MTFHHRGDFYYFRPDGRGKKNTMSYEQWVSRKKVEQQKVIDVRKREEERKRMEEEERYAVSQFKCISNTSIIMIIETSNFGAVSCGFTEPCKVRHPNILIV